MHCPAHGNRSDEHDVIKDVSWGRKPTPVLGPMTWNDGHACLIEEIIVKKILAAAIKAILATSVTAEECITIKDGYLAHKGNVV